MLLFKVVSTKIVVGLSFLQHKVDDASQLVGGGRDSTRCSMAGTYPAVVSTQSAVAACQARGSYSQGGTGSILSWLHPGMDNLAAGDLVIGA